MMPRRWTQRSPPVLLGPPYVWSTAQRAYATRADACGRVNDLIMCAWQVEYERRGVSSAPSAAAELLGVGATTESQERLETGDGA